MLCVNGRSQKHVFTQKQKPHPGRAAKNTSAPAKSKGAEAYVLFLAAHPSRPEDTGKVKSKTQ